MKRFFLFILLTVSHFAGLAADGVEYHHAGMTTMPIPLDIKDTAASKKIFPINQEVRVDVFDGYVVVRADYWFNNTAEHEVNMTVALPACLPGNESCTRFYWMRVMINNRPAIMPTFISADSLQRRNGSLASGVSKTGQLPVWDVTFLPGVTQISLNYGMATGAERNGLKGNAMIYRLPSENRWGAGEMQGDLWLRMNGGYTTRDILGLLPDKRFEAGNAVAHVSLASVAGDTSQDALLWYRRMDTLMLDLNDVGWQMLIYKVNSWKPDEKTLKTLLPFSALDFDGKAFQKEAQASSALLAWSWLLGAVLIVAFLVVFVIAIRSKPHQ